MGNMHVNKNYNFLMFDRMMTIKIYISQKSKINSYIRNYLLK